MPDLTPEQKLIWLGLKSETSDDTYSGGGGTPTNGDGEPLAPEDGDGPLAGIRVHRDPGTSYDGIPVPAGTTEVFGARVEMSERTPIITEQAPESAPAPAEPPPPGSLTGTGSDAQTNESSFPEGSPRRGATIQSLSDQGWSVVDVAANGVPSDGSADAAGPINDLVSSNGPSTVLKFPAGNYRFTQSVQQNTDDVAFMAAPDASETPVVSIDGSYSDDDVFTFAQGSSGFVLRGITIDMSADGAGATGVRAFPERDGGYVRGVTIVGENESVEGGLNCQVDAGAVLSVHRFRVPDGAVRSESVDSTEDSIGINFTGQSDGDLHLGQCEVGGHPNNGVYGSGPTQAGYSGSVVIRGGIFYNSDRDQLRVDGTSTIAYPYIYSDRVKPGFNNIRGIWSRYARGVTVQRALIDLAADDTGQGLFVDGAAGKTTMTDSRIVTDSPGRAVQAKTPESAAPAETAVVLDNVTMTGAGTATETVLIRDRGGSTIRNCCINQQAANKAGIVFEGASGSVADTNVNVGGAAIENASQSNVTTDGTCEDPPV